MARLAGAGQPENFCAVNVALYGPRANRWAMTERGTAALCRSETALAIGPSSLEWDGAGLTIRIAETSNPLPRRISGTIRLHAESLCPRAFAMDALGAHRWQPIAPLARVEAKFTAPELDWAGTGYFDMNHGDAPLEDGFAFWNWCRAPAPFGTRIHYDVLRRDGTAHALALHCGRGGRVDEAPMETVTALPRTLWQMRRSAPAVGGTPPQLLRTLEDTPFYTRSVVALGPGAAPAMHESLCLDRFSHPAVQLMLPYRMPRH